MTPLRSLAALPALLALAACGARSHDIDRLDRDLLNGAAAAGASAARGDRIVDHARVAPANGEGGRPADVPHKSGQPARPEPGPAAHRDTNPHARHAAACGGACRATLSHGARWASRLPAALPLPRDAIVGEAAGSDARGCHLRVVSFASAVPAPRLAAFYARRGRAAGYRAVVARHRHETVVAGDQPADDRAFVATLRPRRGGGTDADIVSNAGR